MATEQTLDTINNANLKTVGEMAAHSSGLAMQNAVAHSGAMNQIRELAMGSLAKSMTELDPSQAIAILKATTGNESASQISALLAALSSGQQGVKAAQTTPPPFIAP
jgi:hypothetical protein